MIIMKIWLIFHFLLTINAFNLPNTHNIGIKSINIHQSPTSLASQTEEETTTTPSTSSSTQSSSALPFYWKYIWDLPFLQSTPQGSPTSFSDSARIFKSNIEQIYGGYPSVDGCPMAEGALDDIADGTMFIGLQRYYQQNGR
jgi:hypothetical protein